MQMKMQEIQQADGLASGDNKEKATSDKMVAMVKALAHMKSYQHDRMADVNLVGLLNAHFLAGYEFTSGMLNNALARNKRRMKASLITREGNPTGIYKDSFSRQKDKGDRITGCYVLESRESIHLTQAGTEWYNQSNISRQYPTQHEVESGT
jgi:hypothetical protein